MLQTESGRSGPLAALRAAFLFCFHLWALAAWAFAVMALWQQRARERRELSSLGEDAMKDLGLHPDEIERECAKPFWRA